MKLDHFGQESLIILKIKCNFITTNKTFVLKSDFVVEYCPLCMHTRKKKKKATRSDWVQQAHATHWSETHSNAGVGWGALLCQNSDLSVEKHTWKKNINHT